MTAKEKKEAKARKPKATYNANKLRELILEGKSAPEIKAALGLSAVTFKAHTTKLMYEDKKFYEIPGMSTRTRSTRPAYRANGIFISKNMLEGLPFAQGDKFTIKVEEGNLILVKD